MRVYSFIDNGYELLKAEIDITLFAGLPDLKITGLPDVSIKESAIRIKSALKTAGFAWPKRHQVLVHIRPNHIKKKSLGIDLAIAAGILYETKQIQLGEHPPLFYGELSLKGEVITPDDILDLPIKSSEAVFTGVSQGLPFSSLQLQSLQAICYPNFVQATNQKAFIKRPNISQIKLSNYQARVACIIATGQHNAIFVGSPGTGKTTTANIIARSLPDPPDELYTVARSIWRRMGESLSWRPILTPHHTSSHISIIGGGNPIRPGAITKAHGGTLILDELLEFSTSVQEALRESLETGVVHLARANGMKTFPAEFLCLATTNLCSCGNFLPSYPDKCICSSFRLQKYLNRISGPLFDRFQVLIVADDFSNKPCIPALSLRDTIIQARDFALKRRGQTKTNSKLSVEKTYQLVSEDIFCRYFPELRYAHRKRISIIQVARTIADIDGSSDIRAEHLNESYNLSIKVLKQITSSAA